MPAPGGWRPAQFADSRGSQPVQDAIRNQIPKTQTANHPQYHTKRFSAVGNRRPAHGYSEQDCCRRFNSQENRNRRGPAITRDHQLAPQIFAIAWKGQGLAQKTKAIHENRLRSRQIPLVEGNPWRDLNACAFGFGRPQHEHVSRDAYGRQNEEKQPRQESQRHT